MESGLLFLQHISKDVVLCTGAHVLLCVQLSAQVVSNSFGCAVLVVAVSTGTRRTVPSFNPKNLFWTDLRKESDKKFESYRSTLWLSCSRASQRTGNDSMESYGDCPRTRGPSPNSPSSMILLFYFRFDHRSLVTVPIQSSQ